MTYTISVRPQGEQEWLLIADEFPTFQAADDFCANFVVSVLEESGLALESGVWEHQDGGPYGRLIHEHEAPRFYPHPTL